MKCIRTILTIALAMLLVGPASADPPPFEGDDVTCYGGEGDVLLDVDVDVCKPRFVSSPEFYLSDLADADARAFCRSQAESNAEAICGNLSFSNMRAVCDPYIEQNQFQVCAPLVHSDPEAYCGTYIDQHLANFCDPYVRQTCGDAEAICQGDHEFLNVALAVGGARAACDQANFNMLNVKQTVVDASTNAFNASNSCDLSVETKCPDVSVEVNAGTVSCRRCKFRTIEKRLKDGTIVPKKIVKRCKGPCVFGTDIQIQED